MTSRNAKSTRKCFLYRISGSSDPVFVIVPVPTQCPGDDFFDFKRHFMLPVVGSVWVISRLCQFWMGNIPLGYISLFDSVLFAQESLDHFVKSYQKGAAIVLFVNGHGYV